MKTTLLSWISTLLLILIGFTHEAQAQGIGQVQDTAQDKATSNQVKIRFSPPLRASGFGNRAINDAFVRLKFVVTSSRDDDDNIEEVYFQLPDNGGVIAPLGIYNSSKGLSNNNRQGNGQVVGGKNYRVITTNKLLPGTFKARHAVRFEAIGGEKAKSKKKVYTEEFEIVLSRREAATMDKIHVAVKTTNKGIGYTFFDVDQVKIADPSSAALGETIMPLDNLGALATGSTITPLACEVPAIQGNADPCPGEDVVFSIPVTAPNGTSYGIRSITWQIPSVGPDGLPSNWSIVSSTSVNVPGVRTPVNNAIKVKIGDVSGTVYARIDMGACGIQVVSFATYLGDEIPVTISTVNGDGDGNNQEEFEPGDLMIFTANNNQPNRDKREYVYNWAVPDGWTIFAGQGTSQLIVIAGSGDGFVEVDVKSKSMDARHCGLGYTFVELIQEKDNCVGPGVDAEGPTEVCASSDKIYTFYVNNVDRTGKTDYKFFLPDAMEMVAEGYGSISVRIIDGSVSAGDSLYVNVVAGKPNVCGTTSACLGMIVVDCPTGPCVDPILPLAATAAPICNLSDEGTIIRVTNPQPGVIYDFILPEGFAAIDQGVDYVSVVTFLEDDQLGAQTITVIATNDCASVDNEQTVTVVACVDGEPLPVEMISFNAVSRNGAVELAWVTATEENNDRFEVERSTDGKSFTKIGQVKGSGTSSVKVKYTYTDRSALSGAAYYRLHQVDTDGKSEYSKVVAVEHTASALAAMSVYPNPVTERNLTVKLQEFVKGKATIRMTDMAGRVMLTQEYSGEGAEIPVSLNGANLPAGVYLISVTANGQSTTQRVMVR